MQNVECGELSAEVGNSRYLSGPVFILLHTHINLSPSMPPYPNLPTPPNTPYPKQKLTAPVNSGSPTVVS